MLQCPLTLQVHLFPHHLHAANLMPCNVLLHRLSMTGTSKSIQVALAAHASMLCHLMFIGTCLNALPLHVHAMLLTSKGHLTGQ